jgi:hypothetical protein
MRIVSMESTHMRPTETCGKEAVVTIWASRRDGSRSKEQEKIQIAVSPNILSVKEETLVTSQCTTPS